MAMTEVQKQYEVAEAGNAKILQFRRPKQYYSLDELIRRTYVSGIASFGGRIARAATEVARGALDSPARVVTIAGADFANAAQVYTALAYDSFEVGNQTAPNSAMQIAREGLGGLLFNGVNDKNMHVPNAALQRVAWTAAEVGVTADHVVGAMDERYIGPVTQPEWQAAKQAASMIGRAGNLVSLTRG